jgi:hypothetical protein
LKGFIEENLVAKETVNSQRGFAFSFGSFEKQNLASTLAA